MINALPSQLNQPSVFAVLASLGIHLLAFSGLQAATRQPTRTQAPASVDVVELSADDIGRLPNVVQQQFPTNNPNQTFALFPPLPGQMGPLPNPALNPDGDPRQNSQFYSSNFNAAYLDTFLNTLPPPPPGGGWFSGGSVPILPNPVVIPGSSAPLPAPPTLSQGAPAPANKPPAPTTQAPEAPQTTVDPRNLTPDPQNSIIEIPQNQTTIAAQPQTPSPESAQATPDSGDEPLPSAVSEIQALQEQYRDRYAYNPAGTSVEEAQALLTDILVEMRSATGQADLLPETGIQVKLAFPDPVCPRNASGIAIVALVDAQGYLIESRLIRSSGYEVLDQQALENVNQRSFSSQANGRYTLYQYLLSFADLDGVCFTENAHSQPDPDAVPPA
jgi:outer membrane biosynthesis protein TonB